MKMLTRMMFVILLLGTGFAASFAAGQSKGFTQGSEWALMQAELVAREAGVFMPVSYEEGEFHVVIKQPRVLYKQAQKLADVHKGESSPDPESKVFASQETVETAPAGKERL